MNLDINSLKSVLDKGESVEWAAVAEPFPTINKYNKSSIHLRWCICAVTAAVLIAAYAVVISRSSTLQFQIILPIVIAAAALFLAFRPYLDANTIRRKRAFIITDKRLIIRESEAGIKSMPLESVDEVEFIDKGNGIGDAIFGSAAIKRPYRKIMLTTLMPVEGSEEGSGVIGMVFYNVKGCENIRQLLPKGTKITERNFG